jgi:hypothetical protein
VWALIGRSLSVLLVSGRLLPLQLDSMQYTLVIMGLYLLCLLAVSLVASAITRHLASGVIAGALVLPVSNIIYWLQATLALHESLPLIDWMTAPFTLAVTLGGAVVGAVGGVLGLLFTRARARQRLAPTS